jgi:hypothetical protein
MPKNSKQKKQKRTGNNVSMSLYHPKQISMVPKGTMCLRFQTSANSARYQFTVQNILDSLLFATSATVGYNLMQAIKVRYIEMWGIASAGTINNISIQYDLVGSSGDTPGKVYTDTTLGTTEPSHLKVSPPAGSAAHQWQTNNNESFFILGVFSNTVIDICFDYVLPSALSVQEQNALVGATAGTIYSRGLDGLATAATSFPMVLGTYAAI